jgi:thiaminase
VEVGTLIDNAVIIRLGGNYKSLGKFRELSQKFKIATLLEKNFWEMNNI